jgi:hypothetical protein
MSRDVRHTLGAKIDALLIETMELIFVASYLGRRQKGPYLQRADAKLDLAKFFLYILWDAKGLDDAKYLALSGQFENIGKMLGGWIKDAEGKTPVG